MKPCDLQPSASWLRRSGGPWLRALVLVAVLTTPVAFAQDKPSEAPLRQLSLANKPWQGDFDQMLERRLIRVLIPYSRTLFFNDKGCERGITAENVRDVERYLPQKYAKQLGQRPLMVFLIPTTRGLDPDQWFNNVEVVTAERIGIEPTTYVRNIYKYYVAYKLMQDAQAVARQAHDQVAPAAKEAVHARSG